MVGTVWLPTCSYLISILLFWWDSLCSHLYLFISYSGLTFVMAPLFVHLLAQFLFQSYLLINCSTGLYEDQLAEILFQSYLLTNNCYKLSIAVYAPTWHLTAVLDLTNSIHKHFSCQGPLFYTSAQIRHYGTKLVFSQNLLFRPKSRAGIFGESRLVNQFKTNQQINSKRT